MSEIETLLAGKSRTLDRRLVSRYTHDRLKTLRQDVLRSPSCKNYRRVLRQVFDGWDRAQYLLVVPALLAVLEGVLAHVGGHTNTNVRQ